MARNVQTRLLLQHVPSDAFARVISFVTKDIAVQNVIISLIFPSISPSEREDLYRSLCRLHWKSVADESFKNTWRPNITNWETLYRLLQNWVPREGFYTLLDAAPWGLLFRVRFSEGKLVGDLFWPSEEILKSTEEDGKEKKNTDSTFESVRVLEVSFSEQNGNISNIIFCGESDDKLELSPLNKDKFPLRSTNQLQGSGHLAADWGFPGHFPVVLLSEGQRALRLCRSDMDCGDGANMTLRDVDYLRKWNPDRVTSPTALLLSLWRSEDSPHLTFDWVDGPFRDSTFQYLKGMPVIRPGLYSGIYHPELYGKFKREIILVEYKKYMLVRDESNDSTWEKIGSEVFNLPEHRDNGIFQMTRENVTKTRSESVIFVIGLKVTGDYHVPMRKTSFAALVHPTIVGKNESEFLGLTVRDREGNQYNVVNKWSGWGTLAYPGFRSPSFSGGRLVQVEHFDQSKRSVNTSEKLDTFGFLWANQSGREVVLLSRMTEQDEFPWFR